MFEYVRWKVVLRFYLFEYSKYSISIVKLQKQMFAIVNLYKKFYVLNMLGEKRF